MEGYPQQPYPNAPYGMAEINQSMESLNIADQPLRTKHKRPARAYHNLNVQPQDPVSNPYGPMGGAPNPALSQSDLSQAADSYQTFTPLQSFSPAAQFANIQQQQYLQQQQPLNSGPMNAPRQFRGSVTDSSQSNLLYTGTDAIPMMNTERRLAFEKIVANPCFRTFENACPPAAGTNYAVVDQGLSGPQYARLTMYNVPTTEALRASTKLPLGLVLRPFAPFSNLEFESDGVPVSDFSGDVPPPRCTRCRAYMNPSMIFTQGGTHFLCNMCQFSNAVSAEYFQPTDPSGRRIDWYQQAELAFGTYDLIVPKDYWKNKDVEPSPLRYLFMIDVTQESVKRGIHTIAVEALRVALYGEGLDPGEEAKEAAKKSAGLDENNNPIPSPSKKITFPPGAKVAIATFDRNVHFYNIKSSLEQPQMVVMSDINDSFVPLEDGMFVDPQESRSVIELLFQSIQTNFENTHLNEPVLGASLEVALQALEKTGGKVSILLGSLPSFGPGAVALRESTGLYKGEKEKELYVPDSKFHKDLGKKFALAGVGVDLFLFPSGLIELSNVGAVCQASGGHEHVYPRFLAERDGRKFVADFCKSCQGEIGTEVSLKVRCSTGLQVGAYFGNFYNEEWDHDPTFGSIDSNSTFGILFKYDGKLDPKLDVHFQSALLYTSSDGQRRVRVNNVIASVTEQYKSTINFADVDACIGVIARDNLSRLGEFSIKELRQRLNERAIDVFAAYRQKTGTSLPSTQLLMPVTLRTFIPYLLGLQKSKAFRDQTLTADTRVHSARIMNAMTSDQLAAYIYPRIMGLHNLKDFDCTYNETGKFILPENIRNTMEAVDAGGVYVCYNGINILLWIHRRVSPALLQDLFGEEVDALEKLDPNLDDFPELDTDVSIKGRALLKYLANQSGTQFLGFQIARQGIDGSDYEFQFYLTEDPGIETFKYKDHVTSIHNQVKRKLEGQKEKSTMSFISEHLPFSGGM